MLAIIAKADSCRLALVDLAHTPPLPYVVPLNFGFAPAQGSLPDRFYFHCAPAGRKLDLIRACNRVCVQLDCDHELVVADQSCGWGMRYASVVAEGIASLVSDAAERRRGLDALMAHYLESGGAAGAALTRDSRGGLAYDEKVLAATAVVRVDVTALSGKRKS